MEEPSKSVKNWYVICTTRGSRETEFFEGVKGGKNSWSPSSTDARLMTEELAESKAKGLQAMKPGGIYEFEHRCKE